MNAASAIVHSDALAQANLIRERLRNAKNTVIGAALGKSDSWKSKVLDDGCGVVVDDIPKLMGELGLKIVDAKLCYVDKETFDACRHLAGVALTDPGSLDAKFSIEAEGAHP